MIDSSRCLLLLWLVGVIALVLVFRQSFENCSIRPRFHVNYSFLSINLAPIPKMPCRLLFYVYNTNNHQALIKSFANKNIVPHNPVNRFCSHFAFFCLLYFSPWYNWLSNRPHFLWVYRHNKPTRNVWKSTIKACKAGAGGGMGNVKIQYGAFSHGHIGVPKQKKRRPCWCTKLNLWEVNFIFMQIFPFVVWN